MDDISSYQSNKRGRYAEFFIDENFITLKQPKLETLPEKLDDDDIIKLKKLKITDDNINLPINIKNILNDKPSLKQFINDETIHYDKSMKQLMTVYTQFMDTNINNITLQLDYPINKNALTDFTNMFLPFKLIYICNESIGLYDLYKFKEKRYIYVFNINS